MTPSLLFPLPLLPRLELPINSRESRALPLASTRFTGRIVSIPVLTSPCRRIVPLMSCRWFQLERRGGFILVADGLPLSVGAEAPPSMLALAPVSLNEPETLPAGGSSEDGEADKDDDDAEDTLRVTVLSAFEACPSALSSRPPSIRTLALLFCGVSLTVDSNAKFNPTFPLSPPLTVW